MYSEYFSPWQKVYHQLMHATNAVPSKLQYSQSTEYCGKLWGSLSSSYEDKLYRLTKMCFSRTYSSPAPAYKLSQLLLHVRIKDLLGWRFKYGNEVFVFHGDRESLSSWIESHENDHEEVEKYESDGSFKFESSDEEMAWQEEDSEDDEGEAPVSVAKTVTTYRLKPHVEDPEEKLKIVNRINEIKTILNNNGVLAEYKTKPFNESEQYEGVPLWRMKLILKNYTKEYNKYTNAEKAARDRVAAAARTRKNEMTDIALNHVIEKLKTLPNAEAVKNEYKGRANASFEVKLKEAIGKKYGSDMTQDKFNDSAWNLLTDAIEDVKKNEMIDIALNHVVETLGKRQDAEAIKKIYMGSTKNQSFEEKLEKAVQKEYESDMTQDKLNESAWGLLTKAIVKVEKAKQEKAAAADKERIKAAAADKERIAAKEKRQAAKEKRQALEKYNAAIKTVSRGCRRGKSTLTERTRKTTAELRADTETMLKCERQRAKEAEEKRQALEEYNAAIKTVNKSCRKSKLTESTKKTADELRAARKEMLKCDSTTAGELDQLLEIAAKLVKEGDMLEHFDTGIPVQIDVDQKYHKTQEQFDHLVLSYRDGGLNRTKAYIAPDEEYFTSLLEVNDYSAKTQDKPSSDRRILRAHKGEPNWYVHLHNNKDTSNRLEVSDLHNHVEEETPKDQGFQPRFYQLAALNAQKEDLMFSHQPGGGKTINALLFAEQLRKKSADRPRILVVAPKALILDQWQREVKKAGFDPSTYIFQTNAQFKLSFTSGKYPRWEALKEDTQKMFTDSLWDHKEWKGADKGKTDTYFNQKIDVSNYFIGVEPPPKMMSRRDLLKRIKSNFIQCPFTNRFVSTELLKTMPENLSQKTGNATRNAVMTDVWQILNENPSLWGEYADQIFFFHMQSKYKDKDEWYFYTSLKPQDGDEDDEDFDDGSGTLLKRRRCKLGVKSSEAKARAWDSTDFRDFIKGKFGTEGKIERGLIVADLEYSDPISDAKRILQESLEARKDEKTRSTRFARSRLKSIRVDVIDKFTNPQHPSSLSQHRYRPEQNCIFIVDEAHMGDAITGEIRKLSTRLIMKYAEKCKHKIMVTATPMQSDDPVKQLFIFGQMFAGASYDKIGENFDNSKKKDLEERKKLRGDIEKLKRDDIAKLNDNLKTLNAELVILEESQVRGKKRAIHQKKIAKKKNELAEKKSKKSMLQRKLRVAKNVKDYYHMKNIIDSMKGHISRYSYEQPLQHKLLMKSIFKDGNFLRDPEGFFEAFLYQNPVNFNYSSKYLKLDHKKNLARKAIEEVLVPKKEVNEDENVFPRKIAMFTKDQGYMKCLVDETRKNLCRYGSKNNLFIDYSKTKKKLERSEWGDNPKYWLAFDIMEDLLKKYDHPYFLPIVVVQNKDVHTDTQSAIYAHMKSFHEYARSQTGKLVVPMLLTSHSFKEADEMLGKHLLQDNFKKPEEIDEETDTSQRSSRSGTSLLSSLPKKLKNWIERNEIRVGVRVKYLIEDYKEKEGEIVKVYEIRNFEELPRVDIRFEDGFCLVQIKKEDHYEILGNTHVRWLEVSPSRSPKPYIPRLMSSKMAKLCKMMEDGVDEHKNGLVFHKNLDMHIALQHSLLSRGAQKFNPKHPRRLMENAMERILAKWNFYNGMKIYDHGQKRMVDWTPNAEIERLKHWGQRGSKTFEDEPSKDKQKLWSVLNEMGTKLEQKWMVITLTPKYHKHIKLVNRADNTVERVVELKAPVKASKQGMFKDKDGNTYNEGVYIEDPKLFVSFATPQEYRIYDDPDYIEWKDTASPYLQLKLAMKYLEKFSGVECAGPVALYMRYKIKTLNSWSTTKNFEKLKQIYEDSGNIGEGDYKILEDYVVATIKKAMFDLCQKKDLDEEERTYLQKLNLSDPSDIYSTAKGKLRNLYDTCTTKVKNKREVKRTKNRIILDTEYKNDIDYFKGGDRSDLVTLVSRLEKFRDAPYGKKEKLETFTIAGQHPEYVQKFNGETLKIPPNSVTQSKPLNQKETIDNLVDRIRCSQEKKDGHYITFTLYNGTDTRKPEERQVVKQAFESGLVDYIILSSAGTTGVDFQSTRQSLAIMPTPFRSPGLKDQFVGRLVRDSSHSLIPKDVQRVDHVVMYSSWETQKHQNELKQYELPDLKPASTDSSESQPPSVERLRARVGALQEYSDDDEASDDSAYDDDGYKHFEGTPTEPDQVNFIEGEIKKDHIWLGAQVEIKWKDISSLFSAYIEGIKYDEEGNMTCILIVFPDSDPKKSTQSEYTLQEFLRDVRRIEEKPATDDDDDSDYSDDADDVDDADEELTHEQKKEAEEVAEILKNEAKERKEREAGGEGEVRVEESDEEQEYKQKLRVLDTKRQSVTGNNLDRHLYHVDFDVAISAVPCYKNHVFPTALAMLEYKNLEKLGYACFICHTEKNDNGVCPKCGASDELKKYYKMEYEVPLSVRGGRKVTKVFTKLPRYPVIRHAKINDKGKATDARRRVSDPKNNGFRADVWTQDENFIFHWRTGCKNLRIQRDKLSVRLMNVSIEHLAKAKENMVVKLKGDSVTLYQKITVNPNSLLESKVTSENWKKCVGLEGYEGYEEYEEYEGYEDSEIEYEFEYYD